MNILEASKKFGIEPDKRRLAKIYDLQVNLLQHYKVLGKLPPWPAKLDDRQHQAMLRGFIGYLLEELGEAMEVYHIILDKLEEGAMAESAYVEMDLVQFNEEIADSLHFVIELLIYCNINPDDVEDYFYNYLEKNNLTDFIRVREPLELGLRVANLINQRSGLTNIRGGYQLTITMEELSFAKAGSVMGRVQLREVKRILWDITYQLQLAKNCLKNKSWKQTGVQTDAELFQERVMKATENVFRFYDFIGVDAECLYKLYFLKNKINNERIANKY